VSSWDGTAGSRMRVEPRIERSDLVDNQGRREADVRRTGSERIIPATRTHLAQKAWRNPEIASSVSRAQGTT